MSENSESQTDNPESTDTPKAGSGTSPADADHSGGTASPDDATLGGISDDQLPEDLQPGEDNPLAEPLDPDDEATKDQDVLAHGGARDVGRDPRLLRPRHEVVDQDPDPSLRAGLEVAQVVGEVVDAAGITGG